MPAAMPTVPGVGHRSLTIRDAHGPVAIHLAEAGSGAPVLLLHGWPQHWYCWRHLVPPLADRYHLLMPDLRGFGWSGTPGRGYDPVTFAADAIAVLDQLGLDRVRLVGHDWGGFTAFLLAVAHPERFERVVVLNAPPLWTAMSARLLASLWRTWYVALLASPLGPRLLTSRRWLRWLAPAGRRSPFGTEDLEIYAERLREPARALASTQLYRGYLRAAGETIVRRRYRDRHLSVPTLLLFGADDFFIPKAYLAGYESNAPDLRLEFIDHCGHFTPEEEPEIVAGRILEFFG
ncbi:MAG: alpha/beta hydrolase [Micromonosporaceae bacterium]|nr:alpha/beta hydrolase [Micromonosporaceae bacterium]